MATFLPAMNSKNLRLIPGERRFGTCLMRRLEDNCHAWNSSKGLEFNSVAIPDLGCMPCARVSADEGARLLYVALTRS